MGCKELNSLVTATLLVIRQIHASDALQIPLLRWVSRYEYTQLFLSTGSNCALQGSLHTFLFCLGIVLAGMDMVIAYTDIRSPSR